MYRTLVTTLLVACLAIACYTQSTSYPDLYCSEEKVGYAYPLRPPLNTYYTCHDPNTPMVFTCVDGTGFIRNGTMTGCVPWVLWDCTNKDGAPACTADQQLTKFPHTQPNLFWICQGIGIPEALSCPEGSAFVPSGTNNGCQPWSVWESETCPNLS